MFFERLENSLGVNSPEDFKRLTIIGLNTCAADRADIQYADQARYFLEQLGCEFVYRNNELVIGTDREVTDGIAGGVLSYTKAEIPTYIPIISPPAEETEIIEPATTALVPVAEGEVSKKEFRLKVELKNTVVELLRSGQTEMAAVMLFSSSERSIYESILIAGEIAGENPKDIFVGHERFIEIMQLQSDIDLTGSGTMKTDTGASLLGYLLGRYAAVAPIHAAKLIVEAASSRILGSFNIPKAIDILSYMEKDEFIANALVGLTAAGKTGLADKIFKLVNPLSRDRFNSSLNIMHENYRECFFSAEEYQEKTIFRDNKAAIKVYEAEDVPLSTSTALMRPEAGVRRVADFAPDYYLIVMIRKLLAQDQTQLGAPALPPEN